MGYAFHKKIKTETIMHGIRVRIANLDVRQGPYKVFLRARFPCRSSLFKLVDNFYFYDWKECYVSITDEDLAILKSVIAFRKKYSIWRKGLEILETESIEEAWKFFEEKAQLFRMLGEIKNENK